MADDSLSGTRKLFIAGMLGFNLVVVVQSLGISKLNLPLTITVILFSLSLPLQVLLLAINEFRTNESDDFISGGTWPANYMLIVSTIGFSIGLTSLFFHFSILAGSVFLLSSITSIFILFYYRKWESK
ncbi:MAG: hypothetical protein WBB45_10045 [Cyclobacteriaceae bacterium]